MVIISSKRMRCFLGQAVKGLLPGVLWSICMLAFGLRRWDGGGRFSQPCTGLWSCDGPYPAVAELRLLFSPFGRARAVFLLSEEFRRSRWCLLFSFQGFWGSTVGNVCIIWETDIGLSVLGNFNQWHTGSKATITSSFKVV